MFGFSPSGAPSVSETGRLLQSRDWSATALGPSQAWPASLRAVTSMMLASPVPMSVTWGAAGIIIYNDAYAGIAGERHPAAFGLPLDLAWPEIADHNKRVQAAVLGGETLSYRERPFIVHRNGTRETIWVDVDYSPLPDDAGAIGGVFAILTERTRRVLAERAVAAQRDRLRIMFDQAPGFIAMTEGPDHVFSFVNRAYNRMLGARSVVGRSVRDAVPEPISRDLVRALDSAFATGKPFVATDFKCAIADESGGIEDHYLDFVYQPIRDDDGEICGIFAHGTDVSERVLAGYALQRSRQECQRLNEALILANNILTSAPGPASDLTT